MLSDDISKILVSEEDIKKRVKELAFKIEEDYAGEKFALVGILRGAFIFISDLAKNIKSRCSYGETGTTSSGKVKLLKDVSGSITGKNVVIVEDILETGTTLGFVMDHFSRKNPKSLKICTLLSKPARRKFDLYAEYVGFVIPNEFVVGYGLGYDEEYRNLPYVGVLKEEIWKEN